MDNKEARSLLAERLAEYRKLSYSDLVAKIKSDVDFEVIGPTGIEYQVEIQFLWDDKPGGSIRVAGAIDDGGWRAFCPLCEDFIMTLNGELL